MARRKPRTAEKHLNAVALRQARFMGAALSQDDLDDLDNLNNLDDEAVDNEEGENRDDAAKLLRRLLRATGVEVAAPSDPELAMLAAKKIADIRRGASNNQQAKTQTNPLIPGGGAEITSTYMSLQTENARLKMAKRDSDIQLALSPPPSLSPARIEEIASMMASKMGAEPESSSVSLAITDETDEDRLADLLVKHMPGAIRR